MEPRVIIVILNWNGWRDTIECLASLGRMTYLNYWVVVVDNGSTDDSVAKIRGYCDGKIPVESSMFSGPTPEPISILEYTREEALGGGGREESVERLPSSRRIVLVQNGRNYGFAEGNNVGITYSLGALNPDYVMLLNNDTVVHTDFLNELVVVGESDQKIGVLGPKVLYYNFSGRADVIWYAGGRIVPWREFLFSHVGDRERDYGQFDSVRETEWCSGAAMLIRRNLVERSLLSTSYTFGYEDVEYCLNAARFGMRVVYVYKSKAWHKVGVSRHMDGMGGTRNISEYFRFVRNNFSSPVYVYHAFAFSFVALPKWLLMFFALRGDRKALRSFVGEIRRLLA